MDYKKLVSQRKSVREFKKKQVDKKHFEEIQNYIKECKKLDESIQIETKEYSRSEVYNSLKNVAGYNGHMIEAPNYIIILSEVQNKYIENSGYIGEKLILKAQSLGIDSCWVTFNDSNLIKEKLNINSHLEVTCIIALGYEDKGVLKPKKDNSTRFPIEDIVYINKWDNNISCDELEQRGLLDAFSYARMAPSALNRQPWRFIIDNSKVILVIKKDDFTNEYERQIDIGIAMLYFSLIIESTMFDIVWKFDELENSYNIPNEYKIAGYCNI